MTPSEYIQACQRTKSIRPAGAIGVPDDVLHAIIGLSTEAGESLDAIKKCLFYGKPLDLVNLDEEFGDKLFYIAIYLHARGKTFEEIMEQNIRKLKQRFPEKFTEEAALFRDLEAERKAMTR